ncbi:AraC family transcriptional regulator [Undibacterium sp. TJN25]|uniref:AraC family transcriptional regulator n=1 Tax=Undibacterium sp. TJN25 TaxID=3413056 RepID=UPI003BF32AD1
MDPLSEVFSSMRVTAAVSTRLEATAPWGWRSAGEPDSRITFVLVQRGEAVLSAKSHAAPIRLLAGDVFILFDEDPYTMMDDPASAVVDCSVVEEHRIGNVIQFGGGGVPTTFISGSFAVDHLEAKPILSVLPKILHLKLEQVQSRAFQAVLELLSNELEQSGLAAEATIVRLYEILFVYAIRAYAETDALPEGGWLAAISDKQLGKAARAMHARMDQHWSLQTLADQAAMSRTAFATKFKTTVGQTPLEYLTHWRMHRARLLMRKGSHSLLQVAQAVGYDSESSFSRVFKQATGMSPGAFRRHAG